MSASFEHAVVVGAGLIGASLAAAGRRVGAFAKVTAVGRSRANLDTALELDLVDAVSQRLDDAIVDSDLVVLAAPVDTCSALLADVARHAPADCVVTDVGSVKGPLVEEAGRLGLGSRFVGAHPMAGGTDTGAGAADPDLFVDRVCVLTPGEAADPGAVERVRALWQSIGARTIDMDPAEHDRAVADISHTPHMVSFALALAVAGSDTSERTAALAAGGFRDTTRLALSDPAMWSAIARENRTELLASLERFRASFDEVAGMVERADDAELRAMIERAAQFRRRLER